MPLENEKSEFIYVNYFQGKFTIKVPPEYKGDDVVERINKNGVLVREKQFNKLSKVVLADIREAQHEEYGPQWEFIFLDGNDYILFRLSKKSRIATMILRKLENLILTEPITIRSWYFEEEKKSAIGIQQNGKKIENLYTRENPGALPEPKQTTVNNELIWDFSDQLKYWSTLITSLKPHMLGVNTDEAELVRQQAKKKPEEIPEEITKKVKEEDNSLFVEEAVPTEDEEDDLPF